MKHVVHHVRELPCGCVLSFRHAAPDFHPVANWRKLPQSELWRLWEEYGEHVIDYERVCPRLLLKGEECVREGAPDEGIFVTFEHYMLSGDGGGPCR